MKAIVGAGVLAAVLLASSAQSQDLSAVTGTVSMTAQTITQQGDLDGCSLNFTSLTQDWPYKKGAITAVSGSLNLFIARQADRKSLAAGLKVGVMQTSPRSPVQAPAFAYLYSANGTSAKSVVANQLADTPGYRLLVLQMDNALAALLGDLLEGAPVSLFYSLEPSGMDVRVPFDVRVIDAKAGPAGIEQIRSDSTLSDFRACLTALMDVLR